MAFKFQNEYDFCQKVARECGALALTFYSRCGGAAAHKNVKIVSKSSATDLVTDGDKAVEAFFIKTVKEMYPGDKILGEESTAAAGNCDVEYGPKDLSELKDRVWVVDPIDGTMNFVHGFEHWCVSIGFIADGEIQFGVVYQPVTTEIWYAAKGQGSWRESRKGEKLRNYTSKQETLAGSLGAIPIAKSKYHPLLRDLISKGIHGSRETGSAALKICQLAQGCVDLYFSNTVHAWDYCAGAVIASEAGCVLKTKTYENMDLFGRQLLGAGTENLMAQMKREIDLSQFGDEERDKLIYA